MTVGGALSLGSGISNTWSSCYSNAPRNAGAISYGYFCNLRNSSGETYLGSRVIHNYMYSQDELTAAPSTMYFGRFNGYYDGNYSATNTNIIYDASIYYHNANQFYYRAYSEPEAKVTFSIKPSTTVNSISGTKADLYLSGDAQIDRSLNIGTTLGVTGAATLSSTLTINSTNTTPINIIGASHKYLTINPGNGYEAMVRYVGGTGSSWYVGKRTTSQVVGTESFHFYSEAAGSTVAGIDTSGNIFSSGSMRSPIFYDSANTAYYLDPSSTTSLRTVGSWRSDSSTWDGEFSGKIQYHSNNWYIQGADLLIYRNSGGSNVFTVNQSGTVTATTFSGALSGNATTASSISGYNNPTTAATANTIVYRDGSGDITTRYFLGSYQNSSDNVDTGTITYIMAKFGDNYHRSATAAKVQSFLGLASAAYQSTSSFGSNLIFNNYGLGIVGTYDATKYQAVFAMGDSYKLTAAGAVGTLYGIAWSHQNAGGAAANLASHGMLILENGGFKGAWGGGRIVTTADIRGTTFYDYNDTNKYLVRNTTTYTSWYMGGSNNSYSGWNVDGGMHLMMNTSGVGAPCGFYHQSKGWSALFYTDGTSALFFNAVEKITTASHGVTVTGEIRATGDIIAYYSDIRLKKDIDVIPNAIEKIKQLRGVTYTWNDEEVNVVKKRAGSRDIGLIAQEVEAIEPLFTKEYQIPLDDSPKNAENAIDFKPRMSETYKTIKYDKLVALLVEGMKEQQHEINTLNNEIKLLKKQ